jgi:ferric-dicitrate binding protein FerR (iron transport regulator)
MDCELAANLTAARVDREMLSPADDAALDAHLAGCPACRDAAQAMRVQDAQLLRAFAPRRDAARRVAERVNTRIAAERRPAMASAGRVGLTAALAAAAGFALAAVTFRPWENRGPTIVVQQLPAPAATRPAPTAPTPPTHPSGIRPTLATLSLATGLVEFKPAGTVDGDAWQPLSTGASIAAGDLVRTGPKVRCEFVMPEGSQVRLNNSTELRFRDDRLLDLGEGQLWSTVAKADDPFRVQLAGATVTALGTQFDIQRAGGQSVLTVVEGSTRVNTVGDDAGAGAAGSGETVVRSGQRLAIDAAGRAGQPEQVHNLVVATRWVHEILLMKGRGNDELAGRVDDLFAQIGEGKMAFMVEDEIRALGDHCVVPLARYIRSDRSRDQGEKRRAAARIIADVAQPWSAGELIELLDDDDGEVRYHAARALHRLTGETMDRTADQWRAGRSSLQEWRNWWERNKERFPGLP